MRRYVNMDLKSIIEQIDEVSVEEKENTVIWHELVANGPSPSPRVGQTCCWTNYDNSEFGTIYCVGGANPSGSFNDTYALDLSSSRWRLVSVNTEMNARYEHCCISRKKDIVIFGGSNENGNLNDVQVFKSCENRWDTVNSNDEAAPTPRTHHTNAVTEDGRLVVFGGGFEGSKPVEDQCVHVYDPEKASWTRYEMKGEIPSPRQGHVMVFINDKVFVHGGMSGETFFEDLYLLDLKAEQWSRFDRKAEDSLWPIGRAGHSGFSCGHNFIIFGGLTCDGPTNDVFLFNPENGLWTTVGGVGAVPSPRLDFGLTEIHLPPKNMKNNVSLDVEETNPLSVLFFVFGGMDADGTIHNDSYIARLLLK